MKRIQILGVSLLALFALSAIVANIASAETTLLAEWLKNGAAITVETASKSEGTIILEDTKLGIGVLCSGIFDGTVGPNGEDLITKVLSLAGVAVSLSALLECSTDKFCESGTDVLVSPDGLPWKTLLILMENGKFLDIFFAPDYFTECLVLGLKVSETCSVAETGGEVVNVTGGVEAVGAPTPQANCTTGGTGAGIIEFVKGENLTTLTGGGTLTVSSE